MIFLATHDLEYLGIPGSLIYRVVTTNAVNFVAYFLAEIFGKDVVAWYFGYLRF